jgi:CPA1 family monovalent cation:H+ antiporter
MHTGFLALVAIMAALFARLAVFPLTDIANIGGVNKIDRKWQLAMWWGGLRGSIPIALLLLLSHIVHEGQALLIGGNTVNIKLDDAIYSDMLILAFSVILFTLLVQGLTMKSLLDRLGIGGRLAESEARYESALAHLVASRAALRKLSSLSTQGLISEVDRERLAEPYHVSIEKSKSRIFELSETSLVHAGRIESARRDLIRVQIEALRDAERLGQLNPHVIEKTLQALDAALSISEFAHEEIVVVTDEAEIDPDLDIERDSEELIPESTESIVSDASTDSESE